MSNVTENPNAPSRPLQHAGSAANLKARLAKMKAARKWSSGHYSVHVDELHELIAILLAIIETQEQQTEKPPNDGADPQGR